MGYHSCCTMHGTAMNYWFIIPTLDFYSFNVNAPTLSMHIMLLLTLFHQNMLCWCTREKLMSTVDRRNSRAVDGRNTCAPLAACCPSMSWWMEKHLIGALRFLPRQIFCRWRPVGMLRDCHIGWGCRLSETSIHGQSRHEYKAFISLPVHFSVLDLPPPLSPPFTSSASIVPHLSVPRLGPHSPAFPCIWFLEIGRASSILVLLWTLLCAWGGRGHRQVRVIFWRRAWRTVLLCTSNCKLAEILACVLDMIQIMARSFWSLAVIILFLYL